jgi:AAA family ATP:ADP antiporter
MATYDAADRMRALVARLVDLREGEGRPALQAFLSLFGIIAGHTILETARDALFLDKLPVSRLTLVYALLAGLSLLVATGNARFVRAFGQRNALVVTLVVCAYGTTVFHFLPATPVAVFALYLWSALLGTVVAVQFWALAGQLFTVAQGKRLFGPVAAGGVAGAVAGATLAAAVLEAVSVQSLLLVASALFLATAFGLTTLRTEELSATGELGGGGTASPGPRGLAMFREVPYLWGVAALVALSVAAVLTTDYLFKSVAPTAARTLGLDLGPFLARYYAALNAASLVVQLFVAGRILRRFGVVAGLMVLPALLLVGGALSVLLGGVLLVMVTKGADGALRHSLHRVSIELAVLPIPGDVRGRAKALIDASLARGVQAGTAGAILVLATFELATPRILAIVLAVLSGAWLAVAIRLRRPYLDLFRQALRKGSLEMDEAPELDLGSVEAVLEALSSPEPATVLGAMELLGQKGRARLLPGLILYHHDEDVLLRALELVARPDRTDWVPLTERLLAHPSERVRVGAVRALRSQALALDKARSDPSPAVRAHAAFCLAHCEGRTDLTSDPLIVELLSARGDAGRAARVAILDSIRDHADPRWADTILEIVRESRGDRPGGDWTRGDPELVEHAAQAMAVVKDPRFIDELVSMVPVRDRRSAVRAALVAYGEPAQEALERALLDPVADSHLRVHLPRSLSAFGNQRAADFLTALLGKDVAGVVRYKALRGLGRLAADHRVRVDHAAVEKGLLANLVEHLRLLALVVPLEDGQRAAPERATGCGRLVLGLLSDKLDQSLERAFRLLQLAHKNEDLRSVHLAVRSGDRRARANALEFLDVLGTGTERGDPKVRTEARRLLRLVVDDLPPADRVARAGDAVPPSPATYEDALRVLLRDRDDDLAGLSAYHATELGLAALSEEVVEATRERPAIGIRGALLALRRQTQVAHA